MTIDLHNLHDSLFREALSHRSVARDLLKAHLHRSLLKRIDWRTFKINNSSFIQENLKQLRSDVIYRCKLKNQTTLYTLIEHESTLDPKLAVRVLQYNTALMAEHLLQGNKHFPTILNLVLLLGSTESLPTFYQSL